MIKSRSVLRTFASIFKLRQEKGLSLNWNKASKVSFSMSCSSKVGDMNRPYTVIVEGNIGSGKTTFLEPFTRDHQDVVEVLAEPVNL